eukprot:jgi/Bigna1/141117/aug1.60_g15825
MRPSRGRPPSRREQIVGRLKGTNRKRTVSSENFLRKWEAKHAWSRDRTIEMAFEGFLLEGVELLRKSCTSSAKRKKISSNDSKKQKKKHPNDGQEGKGVEESGGRDGSSSSGKKIHGNFYHHVVFILQAYQCASTRTRQLFVARLSDQLLKQAGLLLRKEKSGDGEGEGIGKEEEEEEEEEEEDGKERGDDRDNRDPSSSSSFPPSHHDDETVFRYKILAILSSLLHNCLAHFQSRSCDFTVQNFVAYQTGRKDTITASANTVDSNSSSADAMKHGDDDDDDVGRGGEGKEEQTGDSHFFHLMRLQSSCFNVLSTLLCHLHTKEADRIDSPEHQGHDDWKQVLGFDESALLASGKLDLSTCMCVHYVRTIVLAMSAGKHSHLKALSSLPDPLVNFLDFLHNVAAHVKRQQQQQQQQQQQHTDRGKSASCMWWIDYVVNVVVHLVSHQFRRAVDTQSIRASLLRGEEKDRQHHRDDEEPLENDDDGEEEEDSSCGNGAMRAKGSGTAVAAVAATDIRRSQRRKGRTRSSSGGGSSSRLLVTSTVFKPGFGSGLRARKNKNYKTANRKQRGGGGGGGVQHHPESPALLCAAILSTLETMEAYVSSVSKRSLQSVIIENHRIRQKAPPGAWLLLGRSSPPSDEKEVKGESTTTTTTNNNNNNTGQDGGSSSNSSNTNSSSSSGGGSSSGSSRLDIIVSNLLYHCTAFGLFSEGQTVGSLPVFSRTVEEINPLGSFRSLLDSVENSHELSRVGGHSWVSTALVSAQSVLFSLTIALSQLFSVTEIKPLDLQTLKNRLRHGVNPLLNNRIFSFLPKKLLYSLFAIALDVPVNQQQPSGPVVEMLKRAKKGRGNKKKKRRKRKKSKSFDASHGLIPPSLSSSLLQRPPSASPPSATSFDLKELTSHIRKGEALLGCLDLVVSFHVKRKQQQQQQLLRQQHQPPPPPTTTSTTLSFIQGVRAHVLKELKQYHESHVGQQLILLGLEPLAGWTVQSKSQRVSEYIKESPAFRFQKLFRDLVSILVSVEGRDAVRTTTRDVFEYLQMIVFLSSTTTPEDGRSGSDIKSNVNNQSRNDRNGEEDDVVIGAGSLELLASGKIVRKTNSAPHSSRSDRTSPSLGSGGGGGGRGLAPMQVEDEQPSGRAEEDNEEGEEEEVEDEEEEDEEDEDEKQALIPRLPPRQMLGFKICDAFVSVPGAVSKIVENVFLSQMYPESGHALASDLFTEIAMIYGTPPVLLARFPVLLRFRETLFSVLSSNIRAIVLESHRVDLLLFNSFFSLLLLLGAKLGKLPDVVREIVEIISKHYGRTNYERVLCFCLHTLAQIVHFVREERQMMMMAMASSSPPSSSTASALLLLATEQGGDKKASSSPLSPRTNNASSSSSSSSSSAEPAAELTTAISSEVLGALQEAVSSIVSFSTSRLRDLQRKVLRSMRGKISVRGEIVVTDARRLV